MFLMFLRFEVFTAVTMRNAVFWFLDRGFFYPEDGGDTFFRNVGSQVYMTPHPRRRHSSFLMFVLTLADDLYWAWFIYPALCWCWCKEIGTSSLDLAQLT
jgi:hypothetical protein